MSTVQQAIVLRLYPTPEQVVTLRGWMGCVRFVWNHFVHHNKVLYVVENRFAFHAELSALLPALKNHPSTAFLAEPPAISLVDVSRRYDAALRKALADRRAGRAKRMRPRNAAGFPRFHPKRDGTGTLYLSGQAMSLVHSGRKERHRERGTVTIRKLGVVAVRGGRWPTGHIVSGQLRMHHEVWTLSVQFDAPAPSGRTPIGEPVADVVGVDLGLSCLMADSLGNKIMPTRPLRAAERRLARLQSRFGRQENKQRKEGRRRSNNQKRRQRTIARLHRKVAARREHLLHRTTRDLIAKARVVGLETLSLKGLMQTRLAKSCSDAALGKLARQVDYKAAWYGREVRRIKRFDRSTGCCPDCGKVGPRLALSKRVWKCAGCGAVHDRDVASARWIARMVSSKSVGGGSAERASGNAGESAGRVVPLRRGLGLRRKPTQ